MIWSRLIQGVCSEYSFLSLQENASCLKYKKQHFVNGSRNAKIPKDFIWKLNYRENNNQNAWSQRETGQEDLHEKDPIKKS